MMNGVLCESFSSSKGQNTLSTKISYAVFGSFATAVYWTFVDQHDEDMHFSNIITLASGLQMLGFLLLYMKLSYTKSCAGISVRALALYGMMYVARLTSTLNKNGYLPVDKTGDHIYQFCDIVSLILVAQILCQAMGTLKYTYQENHDSFNIVPAIVVSFVLAFFLHPDLNRHQFYDFIWTFHLFLATFAMVPQLWMMSKMGGEVESLTAHFVGLTCASSLCSFLFWFYGFPELAPNDGGLNLGGWTIILCYGAQLLLSADFMYYYVKGMMGDSKVVLPLYEV